MKGIILAGGSGLRLYPLSKAVCKQLLPVYDKPLIYYPLSVLMLAGISDILLISTPDDLPRFINMFGDGSNLGINLEYAEQQKPNGLAEAFIIGERFIGKDDVALILGDNIFYGNSLPEILRNIIQNNKGSTVLGYHVSDPERYGVIDFDKSGNVLSIEEKPKKPKSNFAITGLYFYDNNVIEYAKTIKPSIRGELEITDLINIYLNKSLLKVEFLGRGYAWMDTGTLDSLIDAAFFVKAIEERQGFKISCVEEIAYRLGYINREQLKKLAQSLEKSSYGQYLFKILNEVIT